MTIYKIHCLEGKHFIHRITDGCVNGWFSGYDFMGSANFGDLDDNNGMDLNEARQIVKDLEASED